MVKRRKYEGKYLGNIQQWMLGVEHRFRGIEDEDEDEFLL
jgi:hypothetical protein